MPTGRRDALPGWTSPAAAHDASPAWWHGVSNFGDLKYAPGFANFDYVNTDAPKGGTARQVTLGTFDNFNIVVGEAKGTLASGADLIYDTLLVAALDEYRSEYGLIAEAVRYPADYSSVTYRLRTEAKWNTMALPLRRTTLSFPSMPGRNTVRWLPPPITTSSRSKRPAIAT